MRWSSLEKAAGKDHWNVEPRAVEGAFRKKGGRRKAESGNCAAKEFGVMKPVCRRHGLICARLPFFREAGLAFMGWRD